MDKNLLSMNSFVLILILFNFVDISITENVKKSVDDNREDNGDLDDGNNESMEIPVEAEPEQKVVNVSCTRRQNSQMHEIRSASQKQFPFIVALMTQQNEYLCSGSIVSNGMVLTTAKCADQAVNYVLVNATNDRKDDTTIPLHIIKTEKFPSYTGSESVKDVAIIYTEKHNRSIASKINLSNITDTKKVSDLEAFGYGLNSDVGKAKELQYIGVELRVSEGDKAEAYLDCIDTKVPTCFKDTGGPVIIDDELFGIVTDGNTGCSKELSSNYAVNKRMVEILPTFTFKAWLDEKIQKNEELDPTLLEIYPRKPIIPPPIIARKTSHMMTSEGQYLSARKYFIFVVVGALMAS